MPFKFNWLSLLANIFSLQFIEISEYQLSSSYRASKSQFFPYIHCKFCLVCPTTKMTSATMKPSIQYKPHRGRFTEENELLLRSKTNLPSADSTKILCKWWLTASYRRYNWSTQVHLHWQSITQTPYWKQSHCLLTGNCIIGY